MGWPLDTYREISEIPFERIRHSEECVLTRFFYIDSRGSEEIFADCITRRNLPYDPEYSYNWKFDAYTAQWILRSSKIEYPLGEGYFSKVEKLNDAYDDIPPRFDLDKYPGFNSVNRALMIETIFSPSGGKIFSGHFVLGANKIFKRVGNGKFLLGINGNKSDFFSYQQAQIEDGLPLLADGLYLIENGSWTLLQSGACINHHFNTAKNVKSWSNRFTTITNDEP